MALQNLSADFAILGQAMQGVALGFAALEERTLDFVAQTVEVAFLLALVVIGTLLVAGSTSADDDEDDDGGGSGGNTSSVLNGQVLFVLLVRADVTGQLAVAVVRTLGWFWKLRPVKMPYTHDIFPLQVGLFASSRASYPVCVALFRLEVYVEITRDRRASCVSASTFTAS